MLDELTSSKFYRAGPVPQREASKHGLYKHCVSVSGWQFSVIVVVSARNSFGNGLAKKWGSNVCQTLAPAPLALPLPPLFWDAGDQEVQGEGHDGGAQQEDGEGDAFTCHHH